MLSRLRDIVSEIAKDNEISVESYNMDKIRMIEKHLDESGDVEVAMKELDGVLGYKWNRYYPEIEKQLERRK